MILNLFEEFGLDSPSFIKKIADGKTSNPNEAIHSVLFRMVRKTEAVGMDVMRLASVIAVIRYNDGMTCIIMLYESLGIEVTEDMKNIFNYFDIRRAARRSQIKNQVMKRFRKGQRRESKVKRQIEKHGPGYNPSSYSYAKNRPHL